MKYTLDQLIDLQLRGALQPAEAARLLTGRPNSRSAGYSRFWLRLVERERQKRIKRLVKS